MFLRIPPQKRSDKFASSESSRHGSISIRKISFWSCYRMAYASNPVTVPLVSNPRLQLAETDGSCRWNREEACSAGKNSGRWSGWMTATCIRFRSTLLRANQTLIFLFIHTTFPTTARVHHLCLFWYPDYTVSNRGLRGWGSLLIQLFFDQKQPKDQDQKIFSIVEYCRSPTINTKTNLDVATARAKPASVREKPVCISSRIESDIFFTFRNKAVIEWLLLAKCRPKTLLGQYCRWLSISDWNSAWTLDDADLVGFCSMVYRWRAYGPQVLKAIGMAGGLNTARESRLGGWTRKRRCISWMPSKRIKGWWKEREKAEREGERNKLRMLEGGAHNS